MSLVWVTGPLPLSWLNRPAGKFPQLRAKILAVMEEQRLLYIFHAALVIPMWPNNFTPKYVQLFFCYAAIFRFW